MALVLLAGQSQAAEKPSRVVVVLSGEESPYAQAGDEAAKSLAARGHAVEKVQLAEFEKKPRAADIYLAVGSKAAMKVNANIPAGSQLVYCMVAGPESLGLAKGTAVTGVSTDVPLDVQLQLIRQALPSAKSVGMLYRADNAESADLAKRLQKAAPADLGVVAVAVDKHPAIAQAIEALLAQKVDVIWTAADVSVYDVQAIKALLQGALRKQTPVFGFSAPVVKAGALVGIGIDSGEQGRQAAELALQVARGGSQPASRAAVVVPAFQVIVNLIVAERLAITLPADVVQRSAIKIGGAE